MRQPPGGGPIDKIPPRVVQTDPQPDSLRIPKDLQRIRIYFSERMNQASLSKNLFVSPPLQYTIEWPDWNEAELLLNDSLLANRTYVISVASGVEDLHRNKMAESYQFAFSTGNDMDRHMISGRVYSDKTGYPYSVFAYVLPDSTVFNPFADEPDYITMSGGDGRYKLNYLKGGKFRILAVDDMNANFLLDGSMESFGISFRDARLDSEITAVAGIDFRISRLDTTPPEVQNVRPQNSTTVQLRFSETVIPTIFSGISGKDSLSGDSLKLLRIAYNKEFKSVLDIFTVPQDSGHTYALHIPALADSNGNRFDSTETLYFHALGKIDTTRFQLDAFVPKDSAIQQLPDTKICFRFSKAVDPQALENSFSLFTNSAVSIPGRWSFPSAYAACFIPLQTLKPDSSYRAVLQLSEVRSVWGKVLADSVASHYFTLISSRELGAISGRVAKMDSLNAPVYLQCVPLRKGVAGTTVRVRGDGRFIVPNLAEGKYTLQGFRDTDRNGRYSFGSLRPFRFAEPFHFAEDTIKVRKRWETENSRLVLPETR